MQRLNHLPLASCNIFKTCLNRVENCCYELLKRKKCVGFPRASDVAQYSNEGLHWLYWKAVEMSQCDTTGLVVENRWTFICAECTAAGMDGLSLHAVQLNFAQLQTQYAASLVQDRQLHEECKPKTHWTSSRNREAHTDSVLFFQYDDNSLVRLFVSPSGTKGSPTELRQQFGPR